MAIRSRRVLWAQCAAAFLFAGSVHAQSASTGGIAESARRTANLYVMPGDRIAVVVLREPELTDTVMVNERGEAAFAKLGVMRVADFTIARLQDTLRIEYARFLRNPAISIEVLRRVSVTGEVHVPSVYLVDVTTTVRDLIARAGGVAPDGAKSKVVVVRDGQRIKVPDWESDLSNAMDLRSGDQVVVGRKNWWALNVLPAVSTGVLVVSVLFTVLRR